MTQSKISKKWHANATKERKAAEDKLERDKAWAKAGPVKHLVSSGAKVCPICKGPMRLNTPNKAGQTWKPFWGCVNYKITGCKGSIKE